MPLTDGVMEGPLEAKVARERVKGESFYLKVVFKVQECFST